MNIIEATRYRLINEGYTPFGNDHPTADAMKHISGKDRTLFWCIDSKKYLIFDHVKEFPGLKVRLTSVKNFNTILCQ